MTEPEFAIGRAELAAAAHRRAQAVDAGGELSPNGVPNTPLGRAFRRGYAQALDDLAERLETGGDP